MFAFLDLPDSYYYRTAKVGQTVQFPCRTELPEAVNWVYVGNMQTGEKYIYLSNVGRTAFGHSRPFTVLDKNHLYSLVMYNVTISDSGYYRCDEDSGLGNHHFFGLTVHGITFILYSACNKKKLFSFCTVAFTKYQVYHNTVNRVLPGNVL